MSADHWLVTPLDAGVRLDKFLADASRLGSRGRATWALERGKVFLNDNEMGPGDASRRLSETDAVRLWMDRPGSARQRTRRVNADGGQLQIVYEDDALIVVNKPAGLLSVPLPEPEGSESVQDYLLALLRSRGKRRPLVVHRIDRDTSGLVIFAVKADAQQRLKDQFRRREPGRTYLAIVYGVPTPPAGSWRDYLVWDDHSLIQRATHAKDPRGKESLSEYRLLEDFGGASLIEVRLITGKRNQIRIQARLRGHTLVGEQRYIFGPDELRGLDFPRQALHAFRLSFIHPISGREMSFEAPLPGDMEGLLQELRRRRPSVRGHGAE
jgi:23S rRNA pseudouridine1911/1915/1917 synthase